MFCESTQLNLFCLVCICIYLFIHLLAIIQCFTYSSHLVEKWVTKRSKEAEGFHKTICESLSSFMMNSESQK
jgi:hypothetical protein